MKTLKEKFLLYLVFFISSLHLGRPRKCKFKSMIRSHPVSIYRKYYATIIGLDHNEPKLPFDKPIENLLDNITECGKPAVDGSSAIVNGHDAPAKAWPWQVFLFAQDLKNESKICGGSLITESWVLTAAHCVIDVKLMLFLGVRDLSKMNVDILRNDSGVQFRRAEKIIVHKGYISHKFDDIALVKLNKAVMFNEYIQPICLPKPGQMFENGEDRDCYVTGWGKFNMTHSSGTILQQAKMNIMPQSMCIFSYALLGAKYDRRNLCLDLNDDESGFCYGDSGGPLACKVDGRFVIAGVTQAVPLRYNCSHIYFPPLDVRVTEYIEWIAINTGGNE